MGDRSDDDPPQGATAGEGLLGRLGGLAGLPNCDRWAHKGDPAEGRALFLVHRQYLQATV